MQISYNTFQMVDKRSETTQHQIIKTVFDKVYEITVLL